MFERYFCPRVVARLRASPDADWLSSFLILLDRNRYSRLTIQVYIREAELFGIWMRSHRCRVAQVTESVVRKFVSRPPSYYRRTAGAVGNELLRHLRDRGLIPPLLKAPPSRIERVVLDFDAYLESVAGLASATRYYRRRYARQFLRSVFGTGPIRWHRIQPDHVIGFITEFGRTGRPSAAKVACGGLRSFFRWLRFRGRISANLAAAVPCFPRWQLTSLPAVLTDAQLSDLVEQFHKPTPIDRRNRAIALCLIDLGLRTGEVADLTLDDLDLTAGTMRLAAGKTRRERIVPLTARVRQTVHRYIGRDRPVTDDRHLFVRHRCYAGTAMTPCQVRGIIRRAYAAIPGCERRTGIHILRHTAASRMLRAGADLKRIADILGHQSIDTTAIYAKIDLDQLAKVARPWPGTKGGRP